MLRSAALAALGLPGAATFQPYNEKAPGCLRTRGLFSVWLRDLDSNQGPND